jgi:GNAT superfamily N-acetyltransferase
MTQPTGASVLPQGTLWTLDLDQPLPLGPVPRVPVVFMRAGPEVAQELAQAMDHDDPALVLQRFDHGRHCYVGRIEGTLVTYGWVTFDEEDIGELGLSIRLKAGEAYIWNCATQPAHRGQRLYPALLSHMVSELQHQGLHRVWIGADSDNLPSQSGMVLAGFQPVVDVVISRGPTMRRTWLRGRPGVPEQLVMDVRQALFGEREEVWPAASSADHSAGIVDPPTDSLPQFL